MLKDVHLFFNDLVSLLIDCCFDIVVAPEAEWLIRNTTIPEGQNETVCFTTNIGTATPYSIVIGARPKGQSPASGKFITIKATLHLIMS